MSHPRFYQVAAVLVLVAMAVTFARVTMQGFSAPAQMELEARRAQIAAHDNKPPSVEALARKNRSLTVLKAQSIPFSATLPVINDSTEAKRRTTREVAERAIALLAVSLKAEKTPPALVEKLVEEVRNSQRVVAQGTRFS